MVGRVIGIGEALSAAWSTFMRCAGVLLGINVIYIVIAAGGGSIPYLGALVGILITPPMLGGFTTVMMKAVRGQTPEVGDLFVGFHKYGLWMGVYWLFVAIMIATMIPLGIGAALAFPLGAFDGSGHSQAASIAGMLIFAVAALISLVLYIMFAVRFMFAYYAAADGAEIIEAFRRSEELTRGNILVLLGIAIVLGLVAVAGVIACGIGLILTSLISGLAFALVYLGLKGEEPQAAAVPQPPGP